MNAVLRRVARERDKLPLPPRPADATDRAAALTYLSITLSHPEWLVARWLDRYGFDETEAWARFNNAPAALVLRTNRLKVVARGPGAATGGGGSRNRCDLTRAPDGLVVRRGNPVGTRLHEEACSSSRTKPRSWSANSPAPARANGSSMPAPRRGARR